VQLERLLDRRPTWRALGLVARNALGHLLVSRLAGRDEGHRRAFGLCPLDGERGFPAARAADENDERHRRCGRTNVPWPSETMRTLAP
jgi:hypothetical protein